ncbi:MAG: hypothetical protein ACOC2W_00190 [bacterium]
MLIVSDFHDYYDTAIGYGGIDKSIVYNRTMEEVKFDDYRTKSRDNKYNPKYELIDFFNKLYTPKDIFYRNLKDNVHNIVYCEYQIILFCGEIHPCVYFIIKNKEQTGHIYKCCYNLESVTNTLNEFGNKNDNKLLSKVTWCYDIKKSIKSNDRLTLFFNNSIPNNIIIDFQQKYNCPIISFINQERYVQKTILNPILKNSQFVQVYDPFQTFQKLEMFISGILGAGQKDLIEIDDKHQRDKKGFDERSFKNMPRL